MKNPINLIKALLFCAIFVASSQADAQDFEVAPVRVTFNAAPGETQSRNVTIKNHSSRRETITLRMFDFLVQRDGRMENLPAGSTRNSIASWVTLNPSFMELEPNESRTIQVNLQAPNDDFASKWGILSFVTTAEQTVFTADRDLQAGVSVAGRIDIYLMYNPSTSEPGRIDISNLQEIESTNPDERHFSVNLENPGERVTIGRIFLIASNMLTGEEKRFRTIEVTTYPQTSREVELTMPNTLPPGKYSVAAILDYAGSTSLKGAQILIDVE
jgi:P pilus assembly chaperone PapD